jgi:hypothetical protein
MLHKVDGKQWSGENKIKACVNISFRNGRFIHDYIMDSMKGLNPILW